MTSLREQKLYFDFMSIAEQDPESIAPEDDALEVLTLTAWELQAHLVDTRKLLEKEHSEDFPATRRLLANKFFSLADTLVDIFSYASKLGYRSALVDVAKTFDADPEDLIDMMEDLSDLIDYADAEQTVAGKLTFTLKDKRTKQLTLAEINNKLNAVGNVILAVHQDMLKLDTTSLVDTFPLKDTWGFYLMKADPSFNALNRLLKIKYNKAYLAK